MDALILTLKLPLLLIILLVIYVLPIAIFLSSIIRLAFGFGARKWLGLASLFSLPATFYLLWFKVHPFTFTTENAWLYLATGLALIAAVFWYLGCVKTYRQKFLIELIILPLTCLTWLIFMITTTNWIVG